MREIKFRAWDKKRTEMLFFNNGIFNSPDIRFDTTLLMQYTGITDQDGKEIYEMDIVQKGSGHDIDEKQEIGLVIYNDGEYSIIWTPHNKKRKSGAERLVRRNSLNNTFPSPANYVLGNYYENRDLIPEIDYNLIKTYF